MDKYENTEKTGEPLEGKEDANHLHENLDNEDQKHKKGNGHYNKGTAQRGDSDHKASTSSSDMPLHEELKEKEKNDDMHENLDEGQKDEKDNVCYNKNTAQREENTRKMMKQ